MDALIDPASSDAGGFGLSGERRVRAFRALDAFAIETYQALRGNAGKDDEGLGREIRKTVSRAGGGLIAACSTRAGSESERSGLETVRAALYEARYQLYLARRLGLVDLRRYRNISLRHDALLKEVSILLDGALRRPP